MAKKRTGYSKKSKDWLGRTIIEHHNAKGEKTGYSKPGKTFWGTPITERYNSKGEKTGYNKKSKTVWGTSITERYNSEGEKTGYNKKSETFLGTPITERYNTQGEKTGYSKAGRTFWGTPITEHYADTSPTPSRASSSTSWPTSDQSTQAMPVSRPAMSAFWANTVGCVAGFVFAKIVGPFVAQIAIARQWQPPSWLSAIFVIWFFTISILVGVAVAAALSSKKQRAKRAVVWAISVTAVIVLLVGVDATSTDRLHAGPPYVFTNPGTYSNVKGHVPPNTTILDELNGSSVGEPYGISYVPLSSGKYKRGALFLQKDASRIEYRKGIPREGTLEWLINVKDGYYYSDFRSYQKQDRALVFSTDSSGGDVTWPGAAKLSVSASGDISFFVAERKYNNPPTTPLEAKHTNFRFNEWHAIAVSFGGQGQSIMVDGRLVAQAPERRQVLGSAGTHQKPMDIPTLGESVSGFWARHRYDGGFEGIVAEFRASKSQNDWYIARTGWTKSPPIQPVVMQTAEIPSGVKSALDSAFPGWTPVESIGEDISICKQPDANFKYWFVWGDFDEDGTQDYAAEINQGNDAVVVALFAHAGGFKSFVVDRFPEGRYRWSVLGVAPKGKTIPDLREGRSQELVSNPRTIDADTILGIACEKSAVAYVYSSSGFEKVFISD